MGAVLAACGGGGGGGPAYGLDRRPALGDLAFPTGLPDPRPLQVVAAFPALTFARPVFVTHAGDGTDRVFVVEQDGRILVFPNREDVTSAATFLDLRAAAGGPVSRSGQEEGLLGLAFDPDYATNGRLYVHYTARGSACSATGADLCSRIVRYTVSAQDPDQVDPSSAALLIELSQPYANHNAGMLAFGADGMLYVGFGDGGDANDPQDNAQDLGTLLGTILRIDVRTGVAYGVPPDNPFVGTPGARGEIYAYGLRNPWRFSFDRMTGDLWVGDVGQGAREEVDRVHAGDDLGWPLYEGNRSNENPGGVPASAFAAPVLDYPRTDGTTIIGGYVSRAASLPSVRGAYLYGDYGSGRVWALVHDGTTVVANEEVASVWTLTSFGEDEAGDLLATSFSDAGVWRFRETGGGGGEPPVPARLSETGVFTDLATLTPNGLLEYDVAAPLWSDGTLKRRWMGVPDAARVTFHPTEAWTWPVGTVLVKHFEIEMRVGDPSSVRRLETRVLVRELSGWRGYAYRWRPDQTDADLLAAPTTELLAIEDPMAVGGVREQLYEYPAGSDCMRCHTPAAGFVLGLRTLQANRDFAYARMDDNQIRVWNHIGLFDRDVGDAALYGVLADPADETLPVDVRARSWLEANCSMCHRPGGPAPGGMDLRSVVPTAAMNVVDVRPTEGDLGLPDPWRVRPGDPDASVLQLRIQSPDANRMPPLGSHVVDPLGVALVRAWIEGL